MKARSSNIVIDETLPTFLEVSEQYDVNGHYYSLVASFTTGPSGKVHTDQVVVINDHTQTPICFSDLPASHRDYLMLDFAKVTDKHLNFYESDIEDFFKHAKRSQRENVRFDVA